jgi:hypothetical protein
MTYLRTLFAAALFCLAAPALAQPYAFAGVNSADFDSLTSPDTSGSADSSVLVGGGYRLSEHLALEGRYLSARNRTANGATSSTLKVEGPGAAILGSVPIGERFSALGFAAVYFLEHDFRSGTSGAATFTTSDNSHMSIGFGAEYRFSRNAAARLTVEQLDGEDEIDRLRIGALQVLLYF